MTREQIQQVREFLASIEATGELIGNEMCRQLDAALAILDAELARPEQREWRAVPTTTGDGEPCRQSPWGFETRERAQKFADQRTEFTVVIESRTPAGPWEPQQKEEPCRK